MRPALRPTILVAVAAAACTGPAATPATPPVDRIGAVTNGLIGVAQIAGRTPETWSLIDRMAKYQVPGVSIAVADSGRVVWARGFGIKQVGTTDSVDGETLFQAASISKPVAATATLRLAEQGKLSLDQDINSYLTSWKLPDNQFTAIEKVTLRRIMSHSAGLSVHGFPGYLVTDPLPTVPQILDGTKPANTAPVRVVAVPGTTWSYSGGGTTVMQLLLMDVTGEPFPALLKRLVLDPAGMTNSLFAAPLPSALEPRAASAHLADATMVPGRWHVYPELAPAALWTTSTDLLKWAIAIADGRAGRSAALLSDSMARRMLTVEMAPTGLGPFLEKSGRAFRFGHGGDNAGFHADLVYFPETGQGAAIMTNGDLGQQLISEIKLAIAAEYGWPEAGPTVVTVVPLDSAALERVVGDYTVEYEGQEIPVSITADSGRLVARSPALGAEELLPEGPLSFVGSNRAFSYRFSAGATGRATGFEVNAGPGFTLRATRRRGAP
jgi:CubicO group peptidase (beta-lactamase class C family)